MRKFTKRIFIYLVCAALLVTSFLTPTAFAASDIYELTFDNIFVFEQWANQPNLKVYSDDTTGGTITTDVGNGSFVLTNNTAATEVFTSFSDASISAFYSMPVEASTEYVFSYTANGTTTNFETFVFYFDTTGKYISNESKLAYQYGLNEWSFTTPENAGYIQVRFDNNTPNSYANVSNIRICSKEVYDFAKDNTYRITFTYSAGAVYGSLPVPQRDNLVFAGWYTGPDGTGEKITSSTAVTPTSKCLYSKWEPIVCGDLEVVDLPIKQDYCVGEKLNTRGLVIGVSYPDGTRENIDEGFRVSPESLTQTGTQTITISYGESSTTFTVNVRETEDKTININGSQKTVFVGNNSYTINYSGTAFNKYEVKYTSDAYVKAEMNLGGVVEEFFLEPSENGDFSGYIDGFLDGITQSSVTSITFTPLDKDYMDFALQSIDLTKADKLGDSEGMVYLSSDDYTIGIDLDWGGALSYLEDIKNDVVAAKSNENKDAPVEVGLYDDYTGEYQVNCNEKEAKYNVERGINLINRNDTGRLVQQSYYGTGSYPYEPGDYNGVPWNYNPVQGGNVKNEPSKIVDLKITETDTYSEIYVKCRPLDWGKNKAEYGNDYITPSYMEAWYTLEDGLMRATCRFVDFSGYPSVTTTQELPAFYCVEPLNNFVYYEGGEAWSDSNNKKMVKDLEFWGDATDQNFACNENWAAFVGDGSLEYGIGLYSPEKTNFYTGVFERDSTTAIYNEDGEPIDQQGGTSYIAIVDSLYFQSYKPISYCYYLTTGKVDEIRNRFKPLAQKETDICNATNTNGFCDMCKKPVEPTITGDKYDVNGDGSKDSVYEISNAGELYWFRNAVNNGSTSANAVLTCDITDNSDVLAGYGTLSGNTSAFRNWTPIGTSTNQYKGHFDGQGYTINGLYMNNSALSYGGLFGYTDSGAVIERVGIDYSYFRGSQYIGGICGFNGGTIENCYSLYTIVKGTSYVGGITGYNSGTVKNCYNAGVVSASEYVGGISGSQNNNVVFSNCYYLEKAATDTSGTEQSGIGKASNDLSVSDVSGQTDKKTIEQFKNGEVAYLLQEATGEQLWGQKTNNSGTAPIFDKSGLYKVSNVSNTASYTLVSIGDMDADADVDVNDYQDVVNDALSGENLAFKDMLRCDIDADGYLDVLDCALLQLMVSGFDRSVPVYLKGDFDYDGVPFTPEDVAAIKKTLINQKGIDTRQKYACDLNFDGVLDIKDKDILIVEDFTIKPTFTNMEEILGIEKKTANVIILGGQSNAYGASPLTQEVRNAVGDTDFSNVKIKYTNINSDNGTDGWRVFFSNNEFETFRLGIGGQADMWFGPEVGISYYLATNEATKNETWYIIKCTAAGTYLGGNWLYDTTGKYVNAANSENIKNDIGVYLADGMVGYVSAALDEISNMPDTGAINIRSFMWMQGESDACVEQWANQYGDLQNILVNKVRSAFESQDVDAQIGFVDGAIAAYDSRTYDNPITGIQGQSYNGWVYSDTVNTHKTNNASLWYVPVETSGNVINKTSPGLYTNTSASSNKLPNSIWIDTSTCKSKLVNGNENGEYDGAHYCGESMFNIGQWFGYGMTQVSGF